MKINKKAILLNLIPIMISLVFAIIWFADITPGRIIVHYISMIQVVLDWFIFPLYLLILNGYFHKKNKNYMFLITTILAIINIFIVNEIHYYSWTLSSILSKDDSFQTFLLHNWGWGIPLYFTLTGCLLIQAVLVIEYFINKAE